MQIIDWLSTAKENVLKRHLPELVPLLEGLAVSTAALRNADEADRLGADPATAPKPEER